jgi:hypothetical protein
VVGELSEDDDESVEVFESDFDDFDFVPPEEVEPEV